MKTCPICNQTFLPNSGRQIYCSETCARKAEIPNVSKKVCKRQRAIGVKGSKLSYDIVGAYDSKCAICGWGLPNGLNEYTGTFIKTGGCEIHHIDEISQGGSSEIDNIILLCPNCHKKAHLGYITKEELKTKTLTEKDIEDYKFRSLCRAADLIDKLYKSNED